MISFPQLLRCFSSLGDLSASLSISGKFAPFSSLGSKRLAVSDEPSHFEVLTAHRFLNLPKNKSEAEFQGITLGGFPHSDIPG